MMAASTASTAVSSLCRKSPHLVGFQKLNQVYARMTYSTQVSANTALRDRGSRGPANRRAKREAGQPRTEKMPVDQDWTSVYPSAASFKPASVPLPVRMGYPVRLGVPPEKKGNLELIKWPKALDSDAKCEESFPIRVQTTDYISAGTSLRNPNARVVTLTDKSPRVIQLPFGLQPELRAHPCTDNALKKTMDRSAARLNGFGLAVTAVSLLHKQQQLCALHLVKLSSLNLDDHAQKKLIKLVGERYNKDTDVLTLTTDSCPLRKQNHDYAMYLLTVLYHESWISVEAELREGLCVEAELREGLCVEAELREGLCGGGAEGGSAVWRRS
ncbi:hypothetical protein JZ751_027218 [Albula glossodonta]|uniref:Small ribosomal subunit protein mS35 mitochondrial conserved domain-containing protein n=1 Tax=Albula glossodonta TaxID=121402 RepID=A0A8T2MPT8_9TELE|nr:hypothetical protein JZ751_027218 [Albula glossodonta]